MKTLKSIRFAWKKIFWLSLIVLTIAISRFSYNQISFASENKIEADKVEEKESEPESSARKYYYIRQWGWVTQAWAKDKWDLRESREKLDNLFNSKLSPQRLNELSDAYHTEYKDDLENVTKAFEWVYFCYKANILRPNFNDNQLFEAKKVLEKQEPLTYEESRLRFIIESHGRPVKELITIGDRLVEYDPKDYDSIFNLIRIVDPSRSEEEFEKALSYAKDLVSIQPERYSAYSALGGVYYSRWLRTHNPEDASQAIKAYNTYLQLAPENDSFRSQAKFLINFMSK